MGLSGRKQKQRIGSDPRNLSWADDASKFGQAYLSKLGWDPSRGLGVSGEGRTSHIKVAQKLNLMGIGAGAQQGPDGIAWKQNKDYELLLARLNDAQSEAVTIDVTPNDDDGTFAQYVVKDRPEGEGSGSESTETDERRRRKREKKEKKALEKEAKRRRKEEKRRKKEGGTSVEPSSAEATSSTTPEEEAPPRPVVHRSHRARFLKSKRLAAVSSAAMAEILGVSGTSTPLSFSESGSSTPMPSSSSTPAPGAIPDSLQELTTSTKSVADYFKDKLAQRSGAAKAVAVSTIAIDEEDAPRVGLGMRRVRFEDADFSAQDPLPLTATGCSFVSSTSSTLPPPTADQEVPDEVIISDSDTQADAKTPKTKKRKKSHSNEVEATTEMLVTDSKDSDLDDVSKKRKRKGEKKAKKQRNS